MPSVPAWRRPDAGRAQAGARTGQGEVESEGVYEDGLRAGRWTFRFESGKRRETGKYEDGQREGRWFGYDEAGGKVSQGSYERGRRDGAWSYWNADGSLDEARSGSFRWHVQSAGKGLVWEGEARGGVKDGPWLLRRARSYSSVGLIS